MICRLWRGWTTPDNADAYEGIVRGEVIPGIEARRIDGFRHIDLLRRDLGGEVEFVTLMWFDSLEAIKAFVGADHEVAHVPPEARAVLARFDERVAHIEARDRRAQEARHRERSGNPTPKPVIASEARQSSFFVTRRIASSLGTSQ